MTKIKTELAYRNSAAWAAFDTDGKIVSIICMSSTTDNPRKIYSARSPEVLKLASRTRYCAATRAVADKLNKQIFLKFRIESRKELSKLGTVISGYTSRGAFEFHDHENKLSL